jgi:hypothetical protein
MNLSLTRQQERQETDTLQTEETDVSQDASYIFRLPESFVGMYIRP